MSGQNRARPPIASSVIYITDENEDECVQALQAFLQKSEASPASTKSPDDKQAVTRHLTVVLEWANQSMQKLSAGGLIDEAERSDLICRLDDFVARCQERLPGLDKRLSEGEVAFSLSWLGPYDSQNKRSTLADRTTLSYVMKELKNMHLAGKNLQQQSRMIVRLLKLAYLRPLGDRCGPSSSIDPTKCALYKALDDHTDGDVVLREFLAAFQDRMIDEHNRGIDYYARGISFVNSKGCGKSRLIRNVGLKVPSFHINLDDGSSSGQHTPAPDRLICEFFSEFAEKSLGHVVAATFLSALFQQLYVYVAKRHQQEANLPYVGPALINLGAESLEDADNRFEAALGYLSKHQRRLSVEKQICVWLRDLRSGESGRFTFLDGVIKVARLIIKERCEDYRWNYETTHATHPITRMRIDEDEAKARRVRLNYLGPGKTDLVTYVKCFFELLDGAVDGKGYKLSDLATKENKPHQFIFGVDECHALHNLMALDLFETAATAATRAKVEKLDYPRPQGRYAFLRVFHDMAAYNKSSIEDKGIRLPDPLTRVWLVLIEATLPDSIVDPITFEEKNHASKCGIAYFRLLSWWSYFGMDHAFHIDNKIERDFKNHPIESIQSYQHIKRLGRGIWASEFDANNFVSDAMQRLLINFENWTRCPLFNDNCKPDSGALDNLTFAIASLRFSTDARPLDRELATKRKQMKIQVASHLRYFVMMSFAGEIETATPAEPALSLAALVTLNYGKSLFGQWTTVRGMKPSPYAKAVKSSDSWKRLLEMLSEVFAKDSTVVSQDGDIGPFVARVILTIARDATLPTIWEECKQKVPFTTLRQFIEKLIGAGETEKLFTKNVVENLDKAVVNFNQFVNSLFTASGDPRFTSLNTDAIEVETLIDAFIRQVAFKKVGKNEKLLVIPIGIPKDAKTTPSYGGFYTCYKWQYIMVFVREAEDAMGSTEEYWSSPVVDAHERYLASAAAMVILMDLGTNCQFRESDENYISKHVAGDVHSVHYEEAFDGEQYPMPLSKDQGSNKWEYKWVLQEVYDKLIKPAQHEVRHHTQSESSSSTLNLRIRGMHAAYPELRRLDPNDRFAASAKDMFNFRTRDLCGIPWTRWY